MATQGTRPLVSGLNVVYLYVADMERSLAFYRDVLGLPMRFDEADPGWAEARLPNGLRFALHATHEGVGALASVTIRLEFEVHDIDRPADRLRDAGVEVGQIFRQEYGSFCEFVVPDRYRLQLFEPPR